MSMKGLIIILILLAVPVHAATFIGLQTLDHKPCAKYNFGECQFIYQLHNVPNVAPPQNPNFKTGFHVDAGEGMTYAKARKITSEYAYRAEHPDQKMLDVILEQKKAEIFNRKRQDSSEAERHLKEAEFIDPDKNIKVGQ